MEDIERGRRKREMRWRRLKKLGVTNIRCICGEDDPLCFECEHIYRRALDGTVWGICANCHRKKSAWEFAVNPPVEDGIGNLFARLGHRYAGMSYYLRFCADELEKDAEQMFRLSSEDKKRRD